jgi:hypothetical protein
MVLSDGSTFRLMKTPAVTPVEVLNAYLAGEMMIDSALVCWEIWWNVASCVKLKYNTTATVSTFFDNFSSPLDYSFMEHGSTINRYDYCTCISEIDCRVQSVY